MPKGVIERAAQLYRRRKFSQVIRLLESQIFRFRENTEFYRLLGSACLRTGDFGGAESYLRRADQLSPDKAEILLGLAAVHLKRGESEKALSLWLRVIDVQPGNRTAIRGLNLLREASAAERYPDLQRPGVLARLLPGLPAPSWVIALPLVLMAVAALGLTGYFVVLPRIQPRTPPRPGVAEIQLSGSSPALAADGGGELFTLSEQEVERAFALAKKHLLDYRDNLAIRELNRILLSNASAYVKEKARLLKTFAGTPDFTTVRDPFTFLEVAANPPLYQGSFVVWRGKIANVRITQQEITFDLLVGYEDQRELQGVVPVSLDFAADLEDGFAVEVLGRVEVGSRGLALTGVSLHRLYGVP